MSFCGNCANAARLWVKQRPEVKCRSQILVYEDLRRLFGATAFLSCWSRSQRASRFCCKITHSALRSSCPPSCSVLGSVAQGPACWPCCSQACPLISSSSSRNSPFHLVFATLSISPFFFFLLYSLARGVPVVDAQSVL